jgi:hypothetical protein
MAAASFPTEWRDILLQRVPFYEQLQPAARERFEAKVASFIAEQHFQSASLEITTEMKVVVAAAACRLIMNLDWHSYRRLTTISLRAEAWNKGGRLVAGLADGIGVSLCWPELLAEFALPRRGHNVGYHEFAHALDGADGAFDGLAEGPPDAELYAHWSSIVTQARRRVVDAVAARRAPPIREYAGTNDSELFAVATEYFFERSNTLQRQLPELYDLLKKFYRQDPAVETPSDVVIKIERPTGLRRLAFDWDFDNEGDDW